MTITCDNGTEFAISTHAPAGGATSNGRLPPLSWLFLLTPLREGRLTLAA